MLLQGKQFKLMLSEDADKLTNAYKLPAGCPLTVRKIITDLLTLMREHLTEYVEDSYGVKIDDVPTQFCLTVPAGWTEDVKQLYKEAASDAGLGCGLPGDKSGAVDVVMEPECAALCAVLNDKNRVDQLRAGQVFMVLDAGGGTVDMTLHEVQERPEGLVLSEKVMSRCILQGATRLDERIENHLKKQLVGDDQAYAEWKAKNFYDFQKLMGDWELEKKRFSMDRRQRDVYVKLPQSFVLLLSEETQQELQETSGSRDMLLVPKEVLQEQIFDPIVNKIIDEATKMLQQRKADVLVLAGGFGSNPYLLKRLREDCQTAGLVDLVIKPKAAYAAVMEGSTIHLQRPHSIVTRVSRLTYGLASSAPWRHGMPTNPGTTITREDGSVYAVNVFHPIVRAGDEIPVDHVAEFVRSRIFAAGETKKNFWSQERLYATTETSAMTINEPHVKFVGKIVMAGLNFPPGEEGDRYEFKVACKFGTSCLGIDVYDVRTGAKQDATFEFQSTWTSGRVVLSG